MKYEREKGESTRRNPMQAATGLVQLVLTHACPGATWLAVGSLIGTGVPRKMSPGQDVHRGVPGAD